MLSVSDKKSVLFYKIRLLMQSLNVWKRLFEQQILFECAFTT